MFGSEILEVAIGLILVYSLLALVCSAMSEWVSRMFAMRSKTLKAGIRNLLGDQPFADDLFAHPLIKTLHKKEMWDKGKALSVRKASLGKVKETGNDGPSNIPSRTFALALFDKIDDAGQSSSAASNLANRLDDRIKGVDSLKAPDEVKKVIKMLLTTAKSETKTPEEAMVKARAAVEAWYDDSMDRVSGWYKRQSQLIVLILALGVSLAMNADTFLIAGSLWNDGAARQALVAEAGVMATQEPQAGADPGQQIAEVNQLPLPIGWEFEIKAEENGDPRALPNDELGWIIKLLGILFTTFAVSLGAPFWFDLLNKFVNIRGSGAPPPKNTSTTSSG